MPVLAHDFYAVRPGEVYPEVIPAGSTIDGELAEIAGSLGLLEGGAPAATPKTKAARRAPEVK